MGQPVWAKEMQANIQDHTSQLIEDLKKEIRDEFTLKTRKQKAHIDFLQRENILLKERLMQLECVSMSSNLIISGMPEPSTESEDDIRDALLKLFEDVLRVDTAQNMMIARCHRLSRRPGPYNQGRPRDIIVRFTHFPDRMEVLRGAKNLQGYEPRLYINEQFPAEIDRRRKMLRPILKEARNRSLRANLSRDKLFIDGKSYTVNDIDNIPFPTDVISTITTDTHIYFSSSLSPYSNFYNCHFTVGDVSYCSVEQYYQSIKAAFAEDYDAEAHIMSSFDPVDMLRAGKRVNVDNGEWAKIAQATMETALRAKFGQNPHLLEKLLATDQRRGQCV
jgi:predicted NAD-dependent protein-ADP-ribosyltransferase YbiA (DUF1768 family)